MARQVIGPWYRAGKQTWYATIGGRKVSLGIRGEAAKAEAIKAWHRLMAGPPEDAASPAPPADPKPEPAPPAVTVGSIIRSYLAGAEGRVKPSTVAVLRGRLMPVERSFDKLPASAFTDDTARKWIKGRKLSQSSRHGVIGAMKAMFAWAERRAIIGSNPLRHLERPACLSRGAKAVISEADHARLLTAAAEALKPMLELLRETGARPSELARLTADDVDFGNGIAMLTEHKTDRTGHPRIIILSPKAVGILKEQTDKHPVGALLRNAWGIRWSRNAICHAMQAACERAGVKATAYGYRHTFATDALSRGIPDAHVAALLGHSGTTMLHRHYSHLTARTAVLRSALAAVR